MTDPPITAMSSNLKAAYDGQYSDRDTAWRELCGKYKAENILSVCQGRQFTSVLDCGAGEGSILQFLDASGAFAELSAIEISQSGTEQIRNRRIPRLKEVRQFDGYRIPYPEKSFDLAYCSHVIEHVEHPRILLRELARVSSYQVFEVPLDYSTTVDARVDDLLSYGHINVYTPATFRFLIRSEGFKIIAERLTRMTDDVLRFSWYRNAGLKKTWQRELSIHIRPLIRLCRRILWGRRNNEYGFSAYTCLAQATGRLNIFSA